jgi:hypothetical protein
VPVVPSISCSNLAALLCKVRFILISSVNRTGVRFILISSVNRTGVLGVSFCEIHHVSEMTSLPKGGATAELAHLTVMWSVQCLVLCEGAQDGINA